LSGSNFDWVRKWYLQILLSHGARILIHVYFAWFFTFYLCDSINQLPTFC
jgi:hypothetical protein